MSSIIRQKVGDKIYLYESVSYRNDEGKPRNKRVPIGKIDPSTGQPIYKPDYLARTAASEALLQMAWNLVRCTFCKASPSKWDF